MFLASAGVAISTDSSPYLRTRTGSSGTVGGLSNIAHEICLRCGQSNRRKILEDFDAPPRRRVPDAGDGGAGEDALSGATKIARLLAMLAGLAPCAAPALAQGPSWLDPVLLPAA